MMHVLKVLGLWLMATSAARVLYSCILLFCYISIGLRSYHNHAVIRYIK